MVPLLTKFYQSSHSRFSAEKGEIQTKFLQLNFSNLVLMKKKKKIRKTIPITNSPCTSQTPLKGFKEKRGCTTWDMVFAAKAVRPTAPLMSCMCYHLPLAALPHSSEPAIKCFQAGPGRAQLPAHGKTSPKVWLASFPIDPHPSQSNAWGQPSAQPREGGRERKRGGWA